MKDDYQYAEMLELMRYQGGKDNPETPKLGVMLSANSVKIDDLTLYAEDLYIADYLVNGHIYQVETPYVYDVQFGHYDGSFSTTDKAVRVNGLKAGDLVAVQKMDNNMYLIFARVVRAG